MNKLIEKWAEALEMEKDFLELVLLLGIFAPILFITLKFFMS